MCDGECVVGLTDYAPPPGASEILGLEASGYIEEAGSSGFSKGQPVMALLSGTSCALKGARDGWASSWAWVGGIHAV
jgi:threonine dehydrogenase-like Zn-dependent dehydrogenase